MVLYYHDKKIIPDFDQTRLKSSGSSTLGDILPLAYGHCLEGRGCWWSWHEPVGARHRILSFLQNSRYVKQEDWKHKAVLRTGRIWNSLDMSDLDPE